MSLGLAGIALFVPEKIIFCNPFIWVQFCPCLTSFSANYAYLTTLNVASVLPMYAPTGASLGLAGLALVVLERSFFFASEHLVVWQGKLQRGLRIFSMDYAYLTNLSSAIVFCGRLRPARVLVWLGLLLSFTSYRPVCISARIGHRWRRLRNISKD
jgi:hypothetical protein